MTAFFCVNLESNSAFHVISSDDTLTLLYNLYRLP